MRNLIIVDDDMRLDINADQENTLLGLSLIHYCESCKAYHTEGEVTMGHICDVLGISEDEVNIDADNRSAANAMFEMIKRRGLIGEDFEVPFHEMPTKLQEMMESIFGQGNVEKLIVHETAFEVKVVDENEAANNVKKVAGQPGPIGMLASLLGGRWNGVGDDGRVAYEEGQSPYMKKIMDGIYGGPDMSSIPDSIIESRKPKIEKPKTVKQAKELIEVMLEKATPNNTLMVLTLIGIINMIDKPLDDILQLLSVTNPGWNVDYEEMITDMYLSIIKWKGTLNAIKPDPQ